MSETKVAVRERPPVAMNATGLQLTSFDEMIRFAQAIIETGFAPRGDNAAAVCVKIQAGMELGMTPLQSLQSFVVVNGKLTMYGQAALGKIRASGVCEHLVVGNDGEGDSRCGYVEFKRRDMANDERVTFTLAEAKRAGLANKDTYKSWGDDMLVWRAVSRAAKRYFSDVTCGFDIGEVVREHAPRPVGRATVERKALPGGPDPVLSAIVEDPPPELAQR